MTIVVTTLKKVLFWSYGRGTWQYDVMCVLILAFIFLSPNHLFKTTNSKLKAAETAATGGTAKNVPPQSPITVQSASHPRADNAQSNREKLPKKSSGK